MDTRTAIGMLGAAVMTLGGASIIGATAVGSASPYFHALLWLGMAALVCGMLTLVVLALFPGARHADSAPMLDQSVTSYKQSGGITAHTVNTRPLPRRLSGPEGQAIIADLERHPKDWKWRVQFASGDQEARNLAAELSHYMVSAGYEVLPGMVSYSITGGPTDRGHMILGADTSPLGNGIAEISILSNPA